MRIIMDAARHVLMWSELGQPAPGDGQTAIDLTPDRAVAFLEACAIATNGLTFDGQTFSPVPSPPPPPPLTVDQKLAAVGLTPADLKQALGLP